MIFYLVGTLDSKVIGLGCEKDSVARGCGPLEKLCMGLEPRAACMGVSSGGSTISRWANDLDRVGGPIIDLPRKINQGGEEVSSLYFL
jgi:hypothetical protein